MRKIYKMLISIFMILTLTSTIGIATKPIPTPDQAEQVQDTRLTALETNGTLQQTNNSEQQGLINELVNDVNTIKNQILSLIDQTNSLSNRVANLESSPYNAINSSYIEYREYPNGVDNGDVVNFTFYIPVDAYVYITATGKYGHVYGEPAIGPIDGQFPYLAMTLDNPTIPEEFNKFYISYIPFQLATVGKLGTGYHTVYIVGNLAAYDTMNGLTIAVIVNQLGSYE